MDEVKIEILKCFSLQDILFYIPIFMFVIALKMELEGAITFMFFYSIFYLIIKTFFTIGIKRKERDNTILILIDGTDFKVDKDIFNNLKNISKESSNNLECNIKYVENWIYNILLYKVSNKIIKLLYNYNYIVKLQITSSIKNDKKIKIVYSNIGICKIKDSNLERKIKEEIMKMCNDKREIYEEDLLKGITEYNNECLIPILQFIIAVILIDINEKNISVSEKILKNIINVSNQKLQVSVKKLLYHINYYKYCKITKEKITFNKKELDIVSEYANNMFKYAGETADYNNVMAIISFYKRQKKTTILRYLEKAKRLSINKVQRIIVELNFAFIYFYYRDYLKGISKYKNNLLKLIGDQDIKEEKDRIINEIRDFINNAEEDRIVVGCDMARIFINSCDKEVGTLAEQQLAGLASNSEYMKIKLDTREKFEIEVKNLIFQTNKDY